MMLNKELIQDLSKKYDSFYLYDETVIIDSARKLLNCFPDIEFLYSLKCNPNKYVLKAIFSMNYGADCASAAEVEYSLENALTKEKIFYSSPGKSREDIEKTIDKAIIVADGLNEIMIIEEIAKEKDIHVNIGIRINPNFSSLPSKFGIDESVALSFIKHNKLSHISISGIHVHLKSQQLSENDLSAYYENMLKLSETFSNALDNHLNFVNMGSGMGVDYSLSDSPLDVDGLSKMINEKFKEFKKRYPSTRLLIETGRYVTCKSGIYVTKVRDKKVSNGITYIILNNTLNGFIRPSLSMLISNYCNHAKSAEPLFTATDAFQFKTLYDNRPKEKVSLVGNLCTATDIIASGIMLEKLEIGDALIMTNAGSYAYVLSPLQFSSLDKPKEIFLTKDREVKETYD